MNWVQELLALVARFDPGWASAIRPANLADIKRYTELTGAPLPVAYRELLDLIGGRDANFFADNRLDFNILEVIEHAMDLKRKRPAFDFTACLPVAVGTDYEGVALNLTVDPDDPPVQVLETYCLLSRLARNVAAFAMSTAFNLGISASGRVTDGEGLSISPQEVSHILQTMGFELQWFSSEEIAYFRRDDELVALRMGTPGWIRIGGFDSDALRHASAVLHRVTDSGRVSVHKGLMLSGLR